MYESYPTSDPRARSMGPAMRDPETCPCGSAMRGSDHCPECGCEEYERVCNHEHQEVAAC